MNPLFSNDSLNHEICEKTAKYTAPKLIMYGTLGDITLNTGVNGNLDNSQGSKPRTKV